MPLGIPNQSLGRIVRVRRVAKPVSFLPGADLQRSEMGSQRIPHKGRPAYPAPASGSVGGLKQL
jgi:hypothetical protein